MMFIHVNNKIWILMMFLHGNDKIWIVFTMMMMMFIIINNKSSFYIVFVEKIYLAVLGAGNK